MSLGWKKMRCPDMIPGNKVRMPGRETEWWRDESDERSIEEREEERAREERGRERERALYRGSEGSASASFGGGIIIAQRVARWRGVFHESSSWDAT